MGKEQRSRQYLPPRTVCYLCGELIVHGQSWNRDHVPPERFYGKSVRAEFNPNLNWLYTHKDCNTSYKSDEEYYIAALVGHADSQGARSVFDDFRRGTAAGHDAGLLKTIVSQFGKDVLTDGSITFSLDTIRANRVVWKLGRGIYFQEVGRVLPEYVPKRIILLGPKENKDAASNYPLFEWVSRTAGMGRHGAVFDYKWLGIRLEDSRVHVLAMLTWDRLISIVLFHDPSCLCSECKAPSSLNE